ncbi:MAG: hypothetical protein PVI76_09420, partial [Desulfobacterales bacterium]
MFHATPQRRHVTKLKYSLIVCFFNVAPLRLSVRLLFSHATPPRRYVTKLKNSLIVSFFNVASLRR